MRRTKEEAAFTREQLLKAGLAVFSRRGYSAATLEDVAREAGVTRGAIYWHFGSKIELYNALLSEFSARAGAVVQAAASDGGTLADILRRVYTRLLQTVEEDKDLRAMMEITLFKTERSDELADSQEARRAADAALLEGIAAAMRQGIQTGELRGDLDPLLMARAFLASNNGAIHLWLAEPQAFSLAQSAPALADIFLRGIQAASG